MNKGNKNMFGLMTLKEFAKEFNKPESTIRTWKRRGDLPPSLFIKIGGDIFIKTEEFKKLIENSNSGVLNGV